MHELSSVAQAVLDAATQQLLQKPDGRLNVDGLIAAALRAVVDQVVPVEEPRGLSASREECLASTIRLAIRHEFLTITAELEAH